MKRILKRIFTPFSTLAMVIGVGISVKNLETNVVIRAADTIVTTLSFPDENSANNKVSTYTSSFTSIIGDYTWTVAGFNNNNWSSWTYIRGGRKGSASMASIATDVKIASPISSINVQVDSVTAANVNSTSLTIASNKDFTMDLQEIPGPDVKTGQMIYQITNPGENLFYRLNYDFKSGSGNGFIQISKVEYINVVQNLEPELLLEKDSINILPGSSSSMTVQAKNFTPTSYSWTKVDPSELITLQNVDTSTVTIQAGLTEGQVTLSIEATDGVITKSASVNVSVQELAEGIYTIAPIDTDYSNPMDTSKLSILKDNPELGTILFSNIDNTRLNSSPNANKTITIGGNSTTGGKFVVTLPDGLYATSIKFNGLIVDSGKTPILKINDGVNFKYSGNQSETLNPFANVLEISTIGTSRIWTTSIEITAKTASNAALDFGQHFLDTTAAECASLDVLSTTWDNLKTLFDGADDLVKAEILAGVANVEGNVLEQAIARYNFIQTKYNFTDFLVGVSNPKANHRDNLRSNILSPMTLVLTFMSLLSVAGFYLIRKKSNN
ncbi:MAG: hypothetical protein WC968_03965 [Bacilli bacterium]